MTPKEIQEEIFELVDNIFKSFSINDSRYIVINQNLNIIDLNYLDKTYKVNIYSNTFNITHNSGIWGTPFGYMNAEEILESLKIELRDAKIENILKDGKS